MSKHFIKLKERMEEEKRPEFDFYFLGYIHGLGSAGVLEDGEECELLKLLGSRKEKLWQEGCTAQENFQKFSDVQKVRHTHLSA